MVFLFNNNRALYRVNLWETIYSPQTLWSALFYFYGECFMNSNAISKEARRVYREYYGDIPKGFHVHHIDRNNRNNSPENLEAITPSQHFARHFNWGECKRKRLKSGRKETRIEVLLYQINNNIYW